MTLRRVLVELSVVKQRYQAVLQVTGLGLLGGAGDGNRTRAVSLGTKPIMPSWAADLPRDGTASDRD